MAINLKFDLTGNPEPPSIVLANRNGNKLGQLNVNVDSIDVSDKFNAASEFSFTLNNKTATINSSIEAGGKTTKEVTLKFNVANSATEKNTLISLILKPSRKELETVLQDSLIQRSVPWMMTVIIQKRCI